MTAKITLRIPLQQYGYLEVTGDTAEDVQEAAEAAYNARLFQTGIEIEQVAVAQSAIPNARVTETRTAVAPEPAPVATAQPPVPAPATPSGAGQGGYTCQHGNRIHRTGTSAKGDWSAWFCPAPKGDPSACKPIWK